MSKQFGSPYLIMQDTVYKLQRELGVFDEDWLQNFVFTHYHILPVNEIESAFGPLIPVCRELPTKVGPIDAIFINSNGFITLVECKLWKNPEARREVVGQILDYAKEISQWSYEDLQSAIRQAQKSMRGSLYQLVASQAEDVDERDFIDSVSQNLRRGRFLLLIIGDGIRENVEQMAEFLQKYAYLNFSFALLEVGIYKFSNVKGEGYFVQPRLLAQTVEIERAIVRIENGQISVISEESKITILPKRGKISEQVFFETLAADPIFKTQLKVFFEKVQNFGIFIEPGNNSMKLKSNLYDCNFGVFDINGMFFNCGIANTTAQMGHPLIGEEYLSKLADLVPNAFVAKASGNRFWWTIKIKTGKKDRFASLGEMLAIQNQWLELIEQTLSKISNLETE